MSPTKPQRYHLHGLPVDHVDMQTALDVIDGFIREGKPHHVVTLDASLCVTARDDADLAKIVQRADLSTPDGAGILWACRRRGDQLPERVSGVDIVERLCAASAEKGYRISFLGAGPGVAAEAAKRLTTKYPGCQIVSTRDGYFTEAESDTVADSVRESHPDIILVALGIPKQERWIDRYRDRVGASVYIGVGGSFDVHSGRVSRAPKWMQKLSLEWLYRLAKNPSKIGKVMTLPKFIWRTLRTNGR